MPRLRLRLNAELKYQCKPSKQGNLHYAIGISNKNLITDVKLPVGKFNIFYEIMVELILHDHLE